MPPEPTAPEVFIWVRRTLDWADEERARAALDPRVREAADLWDATFALPYVRFRRRLVEIADANRAQVRAARQAPLERIPDGAIVLPVDDDDWFAPDVAEQLRAAHVPGLRGFVWSPRWFEVAISLPHGWHMLKQRVRPSLPTMYVCSTNNYALVKGDEALPRLADHCEASSWVDSLPPHDTTIRRLQPGLSAANRSPASITALYRPDRGSITQGRMRLRAWAYRRVYRHPARAELSWAQPSLDAMSALMDELRSPRRAPSRPHGDVTGLG